MRLSAFPLTELDPFTEDQLSKIFPEEPDIQNVWRDTIVQGSKIWVAMFNGRYLAAAIMGPVNQGTVEISVIMVREVTRKRGVGRFLLEQMEQNAQEAKAKEICILASSEDAQQFLNHCGYQEQMQIFRKKLALATQG